MKDSLLKNSNTWREVIERSIQVRYPMGSYTLQNFLIDYGKRVYRLLDSKRFEHDCKKNNLNVFVAATHIALQPKTRIYAVLDDGLNSKEAGLSSYLVDMTKPIFEYQDFPNAEKLLGYKPDSVKTTPASAA